MQFSEDCVSLIKQFEGYRSKPYLDSKRVPTIGFGTTIYENGKKVTMSDMPINEVSALKLLLSHLNREVLPYLKKLITVELEQHQIDAIGCLIYNIGIGNFRTSSLLKKINAKEGNEAVKAAWLLWNKSGGKVLEGLNRRRRAEFMLYNKGL